MSLYKHLILKFQKSQVTVHSNVHIKLSFASHQGQLTELGPDAGPGHSTSADFLTHAMPFQSQQASISMSAAILASTAKLSPAEERREERRKENTSFLTNQIAKSNTVRKGPAEMCL